MLKRMLSASKNESGFTLIELMVVVVIIGVLVAIAIPLFVSATSNAKLNTCKANLRTIDGAISVYYADNSGYPPTGAAGVTALDDAGVLKEVPDEPYNNGATYGISSGYVATCSSGHTY